MNCPVCNQPIPDDSLFCEHCGSPLHPPTAEAVPSEPEDSFAVEAEVGHSPIDDGGYVSAPATAAAPAFPAVPAVAPIEASAPESKSGAKYASVGMFAGVLCLVAAVVAFVMTPGAAESASFGGDFYTYTYQGIAALSNCLVILTRLACVGVAALGLFLICHFGWLLSRSKRS